MFGEDKEITLNLTNIENPYMIPSGRMFDMTMSDIKNEKHQQFVFGEYEWFGILLMNLFQNHPVVIPFYVFLFHGRHNQHFIYKNEIIYA